MKEMVKSLEAKKTKTGSKKKFHFEKGPWNNQKEVKLKATK